MTKTIRYRNILYRATICALFLCIYAGSVRATSESMPFVSDSETIADAEFIVKGKVKQIIWHDKSRTRACFSYTYTLIIDEVFKGKVSPGDELSMALNLDSLPVLVGQKQLVIGRPFIERFFEYCDGDAQSYGLNLSATRAYLFSSVVVGLHEVFGESEDKFRAKSCFQGKRFLFDEIYKPQRTSIEKSTNHRGSECFTLTGHYEDLRANLLKTIREASKTSPE